MVAEVGRHAQCPPRRRSPAPAEEVATKRVPITPLHRRVGAVQPVEQSMKEVLKAQHVLPVVLEGGLEGRAPAVPQVVEVGLGDQVARDVLLPLEAKHPFLHRAQGAALEPGTEQAPGQVQQVQVAALGELTGHARHQPAGAEEGKIEGEAVVGGQPGRLAELLVDCREEGGFVARLGEEELDQLDPVRVWAGDRGREDLGAGSAGEAGRLGVEKAEVIDLQPSQLGARLCPVEPADREHFGPAPGDPVGVLNRLEAARWDPSRRLVAGRRDAAPARQRT